MQHYRPPDGPPPIQIAISSESGNISEMDESELEHLANEIIDYQLTHGSLLKLVGYSTPGRPVNVSVLPTKFPRRCFEEALALGGAMNELYMRAASDSEWLYNVLKPLLEDDDFLAALWDVHLEVKAAGSVQDVVCGIFRSDYMLDQPAEMLDLKQVEMNTFSVAGACHANRIASMHSYLERVRDPNANETGITLPRNNNVEKIVSGLIAAHNAYNSTTGPRSCVLMTVQPFNFNIADERPIEYGLWDHNVPCYRCEWQKTLQQTRLLGDRTLLFRPALSDGELEVSVVFHRAGYEAAEYVSEVGRETRLRLEMSRAIKCPDVLTHLAGFKSVQQVLAQPGVLERFLTSDKTEKVKATFMPMHTLDIEDTRRIAKDPVKAKDYVLKPNREGGGHNIFRSAITPFLSRIPEAVWDKYILMRLIEPPADTKGVLLTSGGLYQGIVVSELGILGACLWRKKADGNIDVLSNGTAGWTFKTKPSGVDEMSVVKGYGCFDCPRLVG